MPETVALNTAGYFMKYIGQTNDPNLVGQLSDTYILRDSASIWVGSQDFDRARLSRSSVEVSATR